MTALVPASIARAERARRRAHLALLEEQWAARDTPPAPASVLALARPCLPADWLDQVAVELGPKRPVSLADCADAVARVESRHRAVNRAAGGAR